MIMIPALFTLGHIAFPAVSHQAFFLLSNIDNVLLASKSNEMCVCVCVCACRGDKIRGITMKMEIMNLHNAS